LLPQGQLRISQLKGEVFATQGKDEVAEKAES
jgi:hypothetical protein